MSDFKTRLNEEITQLGDRLGKLNIFLQSDMLAGLPPAQQDLLKKQAVHMQDYFNVLNQRLSLLEGDQAVSSTFGNDKANPSQSQSQSATLDPSQGSKAEPTGQLGESQDGSQATKE